MQFRHDKHLVLKVFDQHTYNPGTSVQSMRLAEDINPHPVPHPTPVACVSCHHLVSASHVTSAKLHTFTAQLFCA
jgi:hypothetical protein